MEKLQRARAQVKPNSQSQPVLSRPGPMRLVVGNWALSSRKEGELHIHNSDGQQVQCFNACVLYICNKFVAFEDFFKLVFSHR